MLFSGYLEQVFKVVYMLAVPLAVTLVMAITLGKLRAMIWLHPLALAV